MMDDTDIKTGIVVDWLLEIGALVERIVGRRLRFERVHTGSIRNSLTARQRSARR
jgi:hydroxymethylglutaryl-CoA lyase